MPALRTASIEDLDAVYRLEAAGFAPGIAEDRAVFARRIAAFPEGFLVRETAAAPGEPALSAAEDWPLSAYFCGEIWADWPLAGGTGGGGRMDASTLRARFELNHDIGAYHDPEGRSLYLASMTVAPFLRGQGAGRRLFREGLAAMRARFGALEQAVLIVNEAWTGARAIYAGEGFTASGRLADFFHAEGEASQAAIVMERRF